MRNGKSKGIIKLLTAIVILVIVLVAAFKMSSCDIAKNNVEIRRDNLKAAIEELSDLVTIEYNYTDVLTYKDQLSLMDVKIPFTDKKYIIKYSGYIKAGIDLSDAEVDVQDEKAIITLNEPKITDNVIDEKNVMILDEKNNVFNPLSIKDYSDVLKEELKAREEKALEDGILEKAKKNATKFLNSMAKSIGLGGVQIIYK